MFPSGKLVKSGEIRKNTSIGEITVELKKSKFTGYAGFTVKDETGLHDFNIAFVNGEVAGAFHEDFKKKENYFGEKALENIQNHEKTHVGVYDVVSLSKEQVELAVAVRPESEVKKVQIEDERDEATSTNEAILKKYGLSSLMAGNNV